MRARLFVPGGRPDQESAGEASCPSQVLREGIPPWGAKLEEVRFNARAWAPARVRSQDNRAVKPARMSVFTTPLPSAPRYAGAAPLSSRHLTDPASDRTEPPPSAIPPPFPFSP